MNQLYVSQLQKVATDVPTMSVWVFLLIIYVYFQALTELKIHQKLFPLDSVNKVDLS